MKKLNQLTTYTKQDAFQVLKNRLLDQYKPQDGWKMYYRFNWKPKIQDFVFERSGLNKNERVLVEINLSNQISEADTIALNNLAERLEARRKYKVKTIILSNQDLINERAFNSNISDQVFSFEALKAA